jgi:hypothetical protein
MALQKLIVVEATSVMGADRYERNGARTARAKQSPRA